MRIKRKRSVTPMKKYTTPEVEVIKFQIQEVIADEGVDGGSTGIFSGNAGAAQVPDGGGARPKP